MKTYKEFLESKIKVYGKSGFTVSQGEINPIAKPHQKDIITWGLEKGRALIAASFGLGKTLMQIEIARLILKNYGGTFLFICPLGVKYQFVDEDGKLLNIDIKYVRNTDEFINAGTPYCITNYERVRDGGFDIDLLIKEHGLKGVSLDEGSVLRSLGSNTTQQFINLFKNIQFKFVCTATPSPNDYIELINYAVFLGICDRGWCLTRFFQRDSQKAGNLKIHPHHESDFWLWVSSWAIFLTSPADLGYDDSGYSLPEMKVTWHEIEVPAGTYGDLYEKDGQEKMFADTASSLSDASRVKRLTINSRIEKTIEIIKDEQQRILSVEQREREKENFGTVSQNQTFDRPGKEKSIHDGISENLSEKEINPGTKVREKQKTAGAICQGSGIQGERKKTSKGMDKKQSGEKNKSKAFGNVRDRVSGLQRDVCSAERQMCDLRDETSGDGEGPTLCGSLPQDRASEGASLSSLQLRVGPLQRKSDLLNERNGIYSKQFITFCLLNDEQRLLEKAFKELLISTSSITGGEDIDKREHKLYQWLNKETTAFLSKPSIAGSGLNLQQCSTMIFVSINDKFNDFIQGVHRVFRFMQKDNVNLHIIYIAEERKVAERLQRKWKQHDKLMKKMKEIISHYGLNNQEQIANIKRSFGVKRIEVKGKYWTAINNDSVEELSLDTVKDNSIGLIHTSIPFGNHYEYTGLYNDFGHNDTNEVFWNQMDYLIPNLYRVLQPGRCAIIHVKDRIRYGNMTGHGRYTTDAFSDECNSAFIKHGFLRLGGGRITLVTDVVRENNQTYRLGHSEKVKDGSKMGCGLPEYLLLFFKPQTDKSNGYADEPVKKSKEEYELGTWQLNAHSFWRSSGDRMIKPGDLAKWSIDKISRWFKNWGLMDVYDFGFHKELANTLAHKNKLPKTFMGLSPESWNDNVWTDINQMINLNNEQAKNKVQNHICPLPLDIVERVIDNWSMEGDLILDPFGGLGTVGYCAIKAKRKAVTIELNQAYHNSAVKYLKQVEAQMNIPTLFDAIKEEELKEAV